MVESELAASNKSLSGPGEGANPKFESEEDGGGMERSGRVGGGGGRTMPGGSGGRGPRPPFSSSSRGSNGSTTKYVQSSPLFNILWLCKHDDSFAGHFDKADLC